MAYHKGQYVKTEYKGIGKIAESFEDEQGEFYRVWFEERKAAYIFNEEELEPAKGWQGLEEGDGIINERGDEAGIIKRMGDIFLRSHWGYLGNNYEACNWHTLKEAKEKNWKIKDQEQEEENQEDKVMIAGKEYVPKEKLEEENKAAAHFATLLTKCINGDLEVGQEQENRDDIDWEEIGEEVLEIIKNKDFIVDGTSIWALWWLGEKIDKQENQEELVKKIMEGIDWGEVGHPRYPIEVISKRKLRKVLTKYLN